jgi:hypothetical protein
LNVKKLLRLTRRKPRLMAGGALAALVFGVGAGTLARAPIDSAVAHAPTPPPAGTQLAVTVSRPPALLNALPASVPAALPIARSAPRYPPQLASLTEAPPRASQMDAPRYGRPSTSVYEAPDEEEFQAPPEEGPRYYRPPPPDERDDSPEA